MAEPKFCPHCGRELVLRQVEGRERLSCPEAAGNYIHWDNPVPVVAALVIHDGQVLLARNATWPPKVFGLITGFLEKGEAPEQGVLREVKEELGLDGTVTSFIGVVPFFPMNQLLVAYEVSVTGEMTLNQEIDEIRLLPPEKVRSWEFGTGFVVKEWLKKRAGTTAP